MILHPANWALRSNAWCWRSRAVLNAALKASDVNTCRRYSTPTRVGVPGMEEILARVVAPLPTYETRDKCPPPPESNSLEFMHFYGSLEEEDKRGFLTKLSQDFGVDHAGVSELALRLLDTQLRDVATVLQVEDRLRYGLTPRYKQLLNHISRVEGGVKFLVDLRADVLEIISSKASETTHIRASNARPFHFKRLHLPLGQCNTHLSLAFLLCGRELATQGSGCTLMGCLSAAVSTEMLGWDYRPFYRLFHLWQFVRIFQRETSEP